MEKPHLAIDSPHWFKYQQRENLAYFKGSFHYKGQSFTHNTAVECLLNLFSSGMSFEEVLRSLRGHFAFVVKTASYVIAAVDRIRSTPLFYSNTQENCYISHDARVVKKKSQIEDLHSQGLLEYKMSGYTTGSSTIYNCLYQLQAGEMLIWEKSVPKLKTHRYYRYLPTKITSATEDDLLDELAEVTHQIFVRTVEKAKGAPLWVPLSGGYDSRLVICKLKELGYENVQTFSYGPVKNDEAKAAQFVAKTLRVPWLFIPSQHRTTRRFFHSAQRKNYWASADGLSSQPFVQDIEPLSRLKKQGKIPEDAVIINGQSGDYISGNHILPSLVQGDVSWKNLLETLSNKHFSLWSPLKTEANIAQVQRAIADSLQREKNEDLSREKMIALYEYWEWQERQSKYVVNGQRAYDFLNLAWELPLWDDDYLDYWIKVPFELKFKQTLYRKYLERYNYEKLFKEFQPQILHWPGWSKIFFIPAALIRLTLGRPYRVKFMKYADYFSYYGYSYAPYGFIHYAKNIHDARHTLSFDVKHWLAENRICEW